MLLQRLTPILAVVGLLALPAFAAAGSWTAAADLSIERSRHTATLLLNGRVLVAGTKTGDIRGRWTAAGSLATARDSYIAVRLADGRVLVAGRMGQDFPAEAELFDPVKERWSAAGTLLQGRSDHTATRLNDGRTATLLPDGRVLVTGGEFLQCDEQQESCWFVPVKNAELYAP